MRTPYFIIVLFLCSVSATAQITGKWKYQDQQLTLVAKIYQQQGEMYGEIIQVAPEKESQKYLGVFLANFTKTAKNRFKGYFVVSTTQKYQGYAKLVDENTLELFYKWGFFTQKNTWKKLQ